MNDSRRLGFTLVELSIVLVILGLLVGGVLAGQTLIRAAELRSINTDFQRYSTAVNAFREKYFYLPGDMPNATSFWGIAGGTTGSDDNCYGVSSTDMKTCNGNGNGGLFLEDGASDNSAPEWFRAWQHLANAGMIEGRYVGIYQNWASSGIRRGAAPGVNVPKGRISNTGFTLMSILSSYQPAQWWPGNYFGFAFGVKYPTSDIESRGETLTPTEAWNVDTKFDDGKPTLGVVRTYRASTCNTIDTTAADYNLTVNDKVCALFLAIKQPGNSP